MKSVEEIEANNKWLNKELTIKKELHIDDKVTLETSVIIDGSCYSLVGTIEEDDFRKIAEELVF